MIYHEYETIYITRPEIPETEVERLTDKFSGIIEQNAGAILFWEDWGRRKLAYDISKHQHGNYVYINYVGPAELPAELERNLRIEDLTIRFMTVKLAEFVDIEARKEAAADAHRQRAEQLAREAEEAAAREEGDGTERTAAATSTDTAQA